MSLGRTIANFRKQKSLKQTDLAEQLGVHHSHVAKWETDRMRPRRKSLEKIAEALDVSLEDLMAGDVDGVILSISDPELLELVRQIPRLEEKQQEALKVVLQDMLTRSRMQERFQEVLQR